MSATSHPGPRAGRCRHPQRRTQNRTPNRTPKKGRALWRPRFLRELGAWANISRACKRAGVRRSTAYEARETDAAFKAAWDEALEIGCDALEEEAWRRATKGTDEGVFYRGRKVAKLIKYSDVLLIFLLKAHRPEKFRETIRTETWNLTDEQLREMSDAQIDALAKGVPVPQVLAMRAAEARQIGLLQYGEAQGCGTT